MRLPGKREKRKPRASEQVVALPTLAAAETGEAARAAPVGGAAEPAKPERARASVPHRWRRGAVLLGIVAARGALGAVASRSRGPASEPPSPPRVAAQSLTPLASLDEKSEPAAVAPKHVPPPADFVEDHVRRPLHASGSNEA